MGMGRPLRGAVRLEAVSPCPSSWVRGSGTLPASVVNLRSINSFHCKIAESARSPSAAPIPISNTVGRRQLTRRRPSRPTAVAQRGAAGATPGGGRSRWPGRTRGRSGAARSQRRTGRGRRRPGCGRSSSPASSCGGGRGASGGTPSRSRVTVGFGRFRQHWAGSHSKPPGGHRYRAQCGL